MRRFVALSAAVLALVVAAAPVAATSWGHPSAITTTHDAYIPYARSLAVSDGVAHLVDARQGSQLEYRRSTDGGVHWSVPVVLAQPDARFTSVIGDPAVAARGPVVVMAYRAHDATAAYLFIRRSTDGGLTWKTRQQIARVVTDRRMGEPSVAVSEAGVFAVWTDRTNGDVNLRRSTDDGAHFLATERIGVTTYTFSGTPTFTDGLPGLATSGADVYVAWSPSGSIVADSIVLSRSLDGGRTFKAPTTILDVPNYGWPSMAAAGDYLVGQVTAADQTLWSLTSGDRGRHTSAVQVAGPTGPSFVYEGSVAVDDGGAALLTYSRAQLPPGGDVPVGKVLVLRSADGGSHWSRPETAATKVASPGNIGTAITPAGTLLVYGTCSDVDFLLCDIEAVHGG